MRSSEIFKKTTFKLTVLREEDASAVRHEFKQHVINGLTQCKKSLSSKYFYDDRGSELYSKITELDEYYLTRTEHEIFETHAQAIVDDHLAHAADEEPLNLVELGAGDGRKTKILLHALLRNNVNFEYLPIDISRQAMSDLFEAMGSFFKDQPLKVHGIIGEYLESIQHIVSSYPSRRTAVMFIGSSIGNFTAEEAISFLSQLGTNLNPRDMLLLGCDLLKDVEQMHKAYFDSKGITTAFNLNILTRMNEELGTDFKTENFQHFATFNPHMGAMESFLLSKKEHTVKMTSQEDPHAVGKQTKHVIELSFGAHEPIYLECSLKYSMHQVHNMLKCAGFSVRQNYQDSRKWFADIIATAPST